jgi:site-specific DNA recombinase
MKPAILYAAKSTADKNASIPAQLQEGRAEAEAGGWTVVGTFHDENKSAYTGNRGDELEKAQRVAEELAAAHGECAMFIQHSDRLARGDGVQAAHLVEYALWAIKSGVKIVSKQDPQTFADLLYAVVTGQRNHEDSARKSKATRDGIERRAADRGLVTGGGRRRFGYRWAADRSGLLIVVPQEAEVVDHRIYDMTLAGVSGLQICRELEADGIKTVTGAPWHGATVSQILRNPLYKGIVVHKGKEYPGKHEAIVDPEKWEAVATLLASRSGRGRPKGSKTQGGGGGRPMAGRYLFKKGMLRCVCGGSMVARTERRTLKDGTLAIYERYECYNRHRDRSLCSMKPIRRDAIDPMVYRYFERVGVDVEATRAEMERGLTARLAEVGTLRDQARREAQKAGERLARVKRDYLEERITAAEWREFSEELSSELAAAEAQVARFEEQLATIERKGDVADLEAEVLEKLSAIRAAVAGEVNDASGVDAARAALQRLFEGFALVPPQIGQRTPSELAWTGSADYVLDPILRDDVSPPQMPLYTPPEPSSDPVGKTSLSAW